MTITCSTVLLPASPGDALIVISPEGAIFFVGIRSYAQPRSTEDKLRRIRQAAGVARRKGGTPKGAFRPAHYGSGHQTRGIKSIGRLYAEEQLPPLPPAAAGEITMIERAGLTPFVDSLHKEHRVPKAPRRQSV